MLEGEQRRWSICDYMSAQRAAVSGCPARVHITDHSRTGENCRAFLSLCPIITPTTGVARRTHRHAADTWSQPQVSDRPCVSGSSFSTVGR